MKRLNKNEKKIIKHFLTTPIPQFVYDYNDELFDLLDCYEIAFTFGNKLLRHSKINPNKSPWGDGQSVIFDIKYSQLLKKIRSDELSDEINIYCELFLSVLDVFKSHSLAINNPEANKTGENNTGDGSLC